METAQCKVPIEIFGAREGLGVGQLEIGYIMLDLSIVEYVEKQYENRPEESYKGRIVYVDKAEEYKTKAEEIQYAKEKETMLKKGLEYYGKNKGKKFWQLQHIDGRYLTPILMDK